MVTTHYAVLGVPATATTIDIENAYRDLRAYGVPTTLTGIPGLKLEDLLERLAEAHRVLADPRSRAAYDAALAQEAAARAATRAVNAESDSRAAARTLRDHHITRGVKILGLGWAVAGLGAAISIGAGAGVLGVIAALGVLWVGTVCCLVGALLRISERRILGLFAYLACLVVAAVTLTRLSGAPAAGLALACVWLAVYVVGSEMVAYQQRHLLA